MNMNYHIILKVETISMPINTYVSLLNGLITFSLLDKLVWACFFARTIEVYLVVKNVQVLKDIFHVINTRTFQIQELIE